MIYELREYVAAPGKAEALHRRFAEGTLALFEKHGIAVIGFWTDAADSDRIVYLVRFDDEASKERAWAAFQGDPEWQRLKAASEADGPLAARMHSSTLTTTAYWPYDTTVEHP